jgi:hypothetical protein
MPIAAAPLLAGLKKAGVDVAAKAVKDFAKSTKSMEKTAKLGGFSEFRDGLEQLNKFATNMSPLMVPFKVLTDKLQAKTMPGVIAIMIELMELLENPSVAKAIDRFGEFVLGLLNMVAVAIDFTDRMIDKAERLRSLMDAPDWWDIENNPLYQLIMNAIDPPGAGEKPRGLPGPGDLVLPVMPLG